MTLFLSGVLRYNSYPMRSSLRMMSKFVEDKSVYDISVQDEHPRLRETCLLHIEHMNAFAEKHVISQHTLEAFKEAEAFVNAHYLRRGAGGHLRVDAAVQHVDGGSSGGLQHVILDSGCGTGASTRLLAKAFPDLPVIGVDRSAHRLSKRDQPPIPGNALLLRAELVDFWMLTCTQPSWVVERHFILYPNPYPKARHHKRRFPGHPVFPWLAALGGEVVVRSNWRVYCNEFATAVRTLAAVAAPARTGLSPDLNSAFAAPFKVPTDVAPLTGFERKYAAVGVDLFELRVHLGMRSMGKRMHLLQTLREEVLGSRIKAEVDEERRALLLEGQREQDVEGVEGGQ